MEIKCTYSPQSGEEYTIEANTVSEIKRALAELKKKE